MNMHFDAGLNYTPLNHPMEAVQEPTRIELSEDHKKYSRESVDLNRNIIVESWEIPLILADEHEDYQLLSGATGRFASFKSMFLPKVTWSNHGNFHDPDYHSARVVFTDGQYKYEMTVRRVTSRSKSNDAVWYKSDVSVFCDEERGDRFWVASIIGLA